MAVQTVLSTDTPNEGRDKWNTNDTELEAALETHKESGDHDGQYYTKLEINDALQVERDRITATESDVDTLDGEVVKTAGAQEVAGEKTFTSNLKISKVYPQLILEDATKENRVIIQSGGENADGVDTRNVTMYINKGTFEAPNYIAVLSFQVNTDRVHFPSDVYAKLKKLATEEYVQTLVRSGIFVMECSMKYTVAGSGTVNFIDHGSGKKRFVVPRTCRLIGVTYGQWDSANERGMTGHYAADHFFNFDVDFARVIEPKMVFVAGESLTTATLKLYAVDFPVGSQTSTEIFTQLVQEVYDGANEFYITLEFAI